MKPFKVHLRKKDLPNGTSSLYLDFSRPVYHAGKDRETRRDFLGLYVHQKPRTKEEREHNRETLAVAERKRATVLLEIQNGLYGKGETEAEKEHKRLEKDFLAFYLERAAMREGKTKEGWMGAYIYLKDFTKENCKVREVTPAFLLELKDYFKQNKNLSHNSKYNYFAKIKTAVREAFERGIIKDPLTLMVKGFSIQQAERPFLTNAEVKALKDTPFDDSPVFRRASLFAILTGIRWSDVIRIRHEMIRRDESGYYLPYKQKKTGGEEVIFLTNESLGLCEYEEGKIGRIFPISYWEKRKLAEWFKLAGVKKYFGASFHVFRHTFAMRMLNQGEDIATVSALLGHKNIRTTQVYARILAHRKRSAMDRVTLE